MKSVKADRRRRRPTRTGRLKAWRPKCCPSPRVSGSMISQKAKYALRALVSLARVEPGTSVMIGEISRAQSIPKKFLEQILLELKRAGFVASRRGRSGGYVLLKAPEDIMFGEVLRLDRKSTRLNSSHVRISYAVFCLKKKKKIRYNQI